MNPTPNPYEAPQASLLTTGPVPTHMPRTMIAALACYLLSCVFDVVPLLRPPFDVAELFLSTVVVLGVYTAFIMLALWRRWRWARAWVVLTTAVSLYMLASMLWRGVLLEHWDAYLASLLRIAAAVALLLPASRRWFSAGLRQPRESTT